MLGEVLKAARLRAGLSQCELAEAAETAQPAISAYERGRREPSFATLSRLLSAADARLEIGWSRVAQGDVPPPADDTERAARLIDVLLLAEAIGAPASPRKDLRAPRMVSR